MYSIIRLFFGFRIFFYACKKKCRIYIYIYTVIYIDIKLIFVSDFVFKFELK